MGKNLFATSGPLSFFFDHGIDHHITFRIHPIFATSILFLATLNFLNGP